MNERIRELAEQAYEQKPLMVLNPETFEIEHKIGNGGVAMYNRVFNQEKFAELIIKQCAKSLWTEECYTSDLALEEFERNSAKIKEHFGVEE